MANLIKVKPINTKGDKVILWEKHPDHPGGECFITEGEKQDGGRDYCEVAATPKVTRLIGTALVLVEERAKATAKKKATPPAGGEAKEDDAKKKA